MKLRVTSPVSVILLVLSLNIFDGNAVSFPRVYTSGHLVFELPLDCEMENALYSFSVELNCTKAKIKIDKYSNTILNDNNKPGVEVFETRIQCLDNASPYEYLSYLNYTSDYLALIDCPFPEKGSFAPGWPNLKKLLIEHETIRETSALKPEHFDGMEGLLFLRVEVNSTNGITGDLFENLTEIKQIELYDKRVDANAFRNMKKVETIKLSIKTVEGVQEFTATPLKALETLYTFYLIHTNFGHLTKRFFDGAEQIGYLAISDCNITEIDGDTFDKLTNLREFFYWSNDLAEFPEGMLKNKPELWRVNVVFSKSLLSLPKGFLSNLPKLRTVIIINNGIETIPGDLFYNSPNISEIELHYNQIQHFPNELIAGLNNLKSLKIYDNRIRTYLLQGSYFTGVTGNPRIYF